MATKRLQILGSFGSGGSVELDTTLTQEGKAADAKAVGDKIGDIETALDNIIAIQESLIGGDSSSSSPSVMTFSCDVCGSDVTVSDTTGYQCSCGMAYAICPDCGELYAGEGPYVCNCGKDLESLIMG